MMTGNEYKESLRKIHPRIYYMGEKIDCVVDHPMIKPHVNSAAMTYDLACDPMYENLMTATSHLTGKKVNRFTHIHQSIEDLVKMCIRDRAGRADRNAQHRTKQYADL